MDSEEEKAEMNGKKKKWVNEWIMVINVFGERMDGQMN